MRRAWSILVLVLLLVPICGRAQLDAQSLKLLAQNPASAAPVTGADWVLDAPIDPSDYRLGPGDVVGHMAYNLENTRGEGLVDTDGCLDLPGMGRVRVADLSLAEARSRFGRRLARIFNCDSVNVWVAKPRRIQVSVTGADLTPRWLELPYTTRLGAALKPPAWLPDFRGIATGKEVALPVPGRNEKSESASEERPLAWRNVQLLRGDNVHSVDLLRYLRTGDKAHNPMLEGGDRIVWSFRNTTVRAQGPFRQQSGRVEFREGDTPADIIEVLGGPRVGLSGVRYELVRFGGKGAVEQRWDFTAASPECRSLRLKPNDRLYLRCDNALDMAQEVDIRGRVTQPGRYAIEPGRSTLADLLAWARPDSQSAELSLVRITREPELDGEFAFADNISANGYLTRFERDYLKARTLQEGGRISVTYDGDMLDPAHLLLMDGDQVRVLRRQRDVEVLGAVRHPGRQAWREGWTAEDYVEACGGKLKGARLKELRLRRMGEDDFGPFPKDYELKAGDVVMLMPREELTAWDKFKEGIGVLSQILTVVLVARSI